MLDKKPLYLIGASHLGRELESFLELIPEDERDFHIMGYLHNYTQISPLDGFPTSYKILGDWDSFPLKNNDYCLITVGDVSWREKLYLGLVNRASIYTFIQQSAVILKYTEIGVGCIISAHCHISTNVHLGRSVFVNGGSQIGHDVSIGDYCSIMSQVEIGGGVQIGKGVFIGSNATIIPNVVVEDNSIIGAGSVVIKKVKSGTTVFGNPARVI